MTCQSTATSVPSSSIAKPTARAPAIVYVSPLRKSGLVVSALSNFTPGDSHMSFAKFLAVEWKVGHLSGSRRFESAATWSLHLSGFRGDRNRLRLLPYLKRKVHHAVAADRQQNALAKFLGKSDFRGLRFIFARHEIRHRVAA